MIIGIVVGTLFVIWLIFFLVARYFRKTVRIDGLDTAIEVKTLIVEQKFKNTSDEDDYESPRRRKIDLEKISTIDKIFMVGDARPEVILQCESGLKDAYLVKLPDESTQRNLITVVGNSAQKQPAVRI